MIVRVPNCFAELLAELRRRGRATLADCGSLDLTIPGLVRNADNSFLQRGMPVCDSSGVL